MSPRKQTARKVARRRGKAAGRTLTLAAIAAVVIAGGIVFAARSFGPPSPPRAGGPEPVAGSMQVPAITVTPAAYDLGRVSQGNGIVTVDLAVANQGAGELVVHEMETSCGCTRATLIVDGRAGPWFGMRGHGAWPTGWSAGLQPGQRAILRVQYDPDAHGIYRGPIDRTVVIYSNDPRRPETQVRLTGTQVP